MYSTGEQVVIGCMLGLAIWKVIDIAFFVGAYVIHHLQWVQ